MAISNCDKLRNGSMAYDFDEDARCIRLTEDFPETGETGAWFDHVTWVSFDDINSILQSSILVQPRNFADFFHTHTANNGPMLVAALINEGVLKKSTHNEYYVLKTL